MMDEVTPESATLLKEHIKIVNLHSYDKHDESLGQLFIKARTRCNLTASEVAKKLFLTEDRIVSIESDQLQNFDAPIYARGYVQSYAKLVGIPADVWEPLLSRLGFQMAPKAHAFGAKSIQVDPSIATLGHSVPNARHEKKNQKVLWLSAMFIVFIVICVSFWNLDTSDHHHIISLQAATQQIPFQLKQGL